MRIWDTGTGREVYALREQKREVTGVAFSPDGHRLALAAVSGDLSVWDTTTAAKLFTVTYLLAGYKEPNRFSVDDITSIRSEILYAQAYAKRFHKELTEWSAKYASPFEQVDYAELMKGVQS